ncbi:MAG: tetratricopeptide repeat protein [Bacteroidetes bacterium]|nr:MAG: tetratricopeptide repeat protein [Bacteroidota bacterium]
MKKYTTPKGDKRMKTIYIIIIFAIFNYLLLPAEDNEQELINILPQKQGIERIECLNKISKIIREDKPQEARKYIYESLKLSKGIGYFQGEGQALLNLGVTESVLGDNKKAEVTFNQALKIYKNHSDKLGIIKSKIDLGHVQTLSGNYKDALFNLIQSYNMSKEFNYNNELASASLGLGYIYDDMCDYNKALDYLNISVNIQKKIGNRKDLIKTLNIIGVIYYNIKYYEKSLSSYKEALNYIDTNNNISLLEKIYNNIGLIYSEQGNHLTAIQYYIKSKTLLEQIQDSIGIAVCNINIGNEYSQMGDNNKAVELLNMSIELLKRKDSPCDLVSAYLLRCNIFIRNKYPEKSRPDLLKALCISQKLDLTNEQRNAYYLLTESYILLNKKSLASQTFQKYKNVNDSLLIVEKSKSLNITNAKIAAITKIEKLNSDLKIEREKFAKLILIIFSILILSIITVLFYIIRKRIVSKLYQKEQQLDYIKVTHKNLHESFSSEVKDKMYVLGNFILESKENNNYRQLKSSYDDVSHIITETLVKYNVDFNSN